jgi:hypothetical protein
MLEPTIKGLLVGIAWFLGLVLMVVLVRLARKGSGVGAFLGLLLWFFGPPVPPPRQTTEEARDNEEKKRSEDQGGKL